MVFKYTDELIEYMKQKEKKNIIVEVAKSDSSDFDVTELHTHFVDDKQSELFVKRQGFHTYETELGKVLLPNYRLEYDKEVIFGIKKVLFWHVVTVKGISF